MWVGGLHGNYIWLRERLKALGAKVRATCESEGVRNEGDGMFEEGVFGRSACVTHGGQLGEGGGGGGSEEYLQRGPRYK